jgi:hypothetical protein
MTSGEVVVRAGFLVRYCRHAGTVAIVMLIPSVGGWLVGGLAACGAYPSPVIASPDGAYLTVVTQHGCITALRGGVNVALLPAPGIQHWGTGATLLTLGSAGERSVRAYWTGPRELHVAYCDGRSVGGGAVPPPTDWRDVHIVLDAWPEGEPCYG